MFLRSSNPVVALPTHAFPTEEFEIHRFAKSGVVMRIWLHGEYITPAPLGSEVKLRSISGFQSLLLNATQSNLKEALEDRLKSDL